MAVVTGCPLCFARQPHAGYNTAAKGCRAQGGDSGHESLGQEGWYPSIPIIPRIPNELLSLFLEPCPLHLTLTKNLVEEWIVGHPLPDPR